jgi:hypothetical protein
MEVSRSTTGELVYAYLRDNAENRLNPEAGYVYLYDYDVLHIPGLGFDGLIGYSPIAMAGGEVLMSPVIMMMIHNPMTIAIGDTAEMEKAIAMLDEVKESIINAYELKTGLSRTKLSHLMDAESWMNAKKAVELGFADAIMFQQEESPPGLEISAGMIFSRQAVTNSILKKLPNRPKGTPVESLEKRRMNGNNRP